MCQSGGEMRDARDARAFEVLVVTHCIGVGFMVSVLALECRADW
jgi:hypothetical protein